MSAAPAFALAQLSRNWEQQLASSYSGSHRPQRWQVFVHLLYLSRAVAVWQDGQADQWHAGRETVAVAVPGLHPGHSASRSLESDFVVISVLPLEPAVLPAVPVSFVPLSLS